MLRTTAEEHEGTVSMAHLPISHVRGNRVADRRASTRSDRAMDVLQYGTAALALAVVALLAVLR